MPRMPAPPPLRLVSRSERSQLDEARDAKARLHATITLAEDHLTHAESFTGLKKFDEASAEVGSYLGLIGDLRDYISKLNHTRPAPAIFAAILNGTSISIFRGSPLCGGIRLRLIRYILRMPKSS